MHLELNLSGIYYFASLCACLSVYLCLTGAMKALNLGHNFRTVNQTCPNGKWVMDNNCINILA